MRAHAHGKEREDMSRRLVDHSIMAGTGHDRQDQLKSHLLMLCSIANWSGLCALSCRETI